MACSSNPSNLFATVANLRSRSHYFGNAKLQLRPATFEPSKARKLSKLPRSPPLTTVNNSRFPSHVKNTTGSTEPTLDGLIFWGQDSINQMFQFRFGFPRNPSTARRMQSGGRLGKQDSLGVAETATMSAFFKSISYTLVPIHCLLGSRHQHSHFLRR